MTIYKYEASWCQPCSMLQSTIERLEETGKIPESKYTKVDIDTPEGMELAHKYMVRSVPTLIKIDDSGFEVARRTGVPQDDDLIDFFR